MVSWPPPDPSTASVSPPGWFRDPYAPGYLRYFDGRNWTGHIVLHPAPGWPSDIFAGNRSPNDTGYYPSTAKKESPVSPDLRSTLWAWLGLPLGLAVATALSVILVLVKYPGLQQSDIAGLSFDPWLLAVSTFGLWLGFGVSFWFTRRASHLNLRAALGAMHWRHACAAVGLALLAQGAGIGIASLLGGGQSDATSPLDPSGKSVMVAVLLGLMVCVGAPVFEELYFRGVVLSSMAPALGANAAVVLQGLLFGLVHFDQGIFGIVFIGFVGMVLGLIRVKTRSLLPGIVFHMTFNALAFAMMLAA